ncbi:hypothetical protein [Geopseudomonas aromaticivorans]
MLALNPELIRSCLPANIVLHESYLAVMPGVGALVFHLKSVPSLSRREAGLLAPVHLQVPMTVGDVRGVPGKPYFDRYLLDGRNRLVEQDEVTMSPLDIDEIWKRLAEAYRTAPVLPVPQSAGPDELEAWAKAHDRALADVKAGALVGASEMRQRVPARFNAALAAADGYHARVVGEMEAALHECDPMTYPSHGGWLGVPEGCTARRIEQVPVALLLASARQQARAAQPVHAQEYAPSMGF